MQNKIITIARQYGSGGRQIGECLAKKLQIPFYDRQVLELAAKQSGVDGAFFEQPEQENYAFRDITLGLSYQPPLSDTIYFARSEAIQSLAGKGPCVIVGCGAGSVLEDTIPSLNVFIYAAFETRKQRAIEEYGDHPHKIEEHIATIDKKRASYYKFYTGINGKQMENYQLCIDSGFFGIEATVKMIETAYLMDMNMNSEE